MRVDALPIVAEDRLFSVEATPDNSGVQFIWVNAEDGKRRWTAAIFDCGDVFSIANRSEFGIRLHKFSPTAVLRLSSGKNAPIDVGSRKQLEVESPYGKKLVVRYVDSSEMPTAVVVGYIDEEIGVVRSVALICSKFSLLKFSLAN